MRKGSYDVGAPGGPAADLAITAFPGDVGGDLANVNRWRGQVNLGPIDEAALAKSAEHLQANGHDYLVIELVSEGPMGEKHEKQRIVAAILDDNGHSWFIKMMGEDATVAAQKSAFMDFLHGLKIP